MDESHSELAWLRTLLHSMEDALFVHDLDGRILECNNAACARMGYTREELLRMRTHDFDAPEFAAGFQERLSEQLAKKRYRCEGVHLAKDGTPIHVDIHTTMIDFLGQPAVLAVMRDITDRKRAETERETLRTRVLQAEKLESLGVMAGGIAHDFNNLLMGVLGNASIAMLDVPEDSRVKRCLEQIESAAQRAANLSQQMLAYSGRATFTFKRLDLRHLVQKAAPSLAASIGKHHRIEYRLDGDASIHADESQLRQVLSGLVANASEAYGDNEGVITVSLRVEHIDHDMLAARHIVGTLTDGTHAVIEVSDSGCGMDERLIERIFDPFFTTKFTGRGLGLAAVIGIVRGHRGAISVSSAVGKGSTFRVYLPAAVSKAVEAATAPRKSAPSADGAVLVVDDEEAVINVSKHGLERAGYTVFTASSGKEAIDLFGAHADEVGLVILDMTMPRMSGEETFRALKAVRDDVRVVVSSGYSRADAALRFDSDQIEDFLQKPYRARELVALVSRIFQRPAPVEASRSTDFQI
ncbi:MAG: PAS domain S-box protein [Candidatus Hydrogenedentes bacterium]|nr:PAS domain S-box protein [Candidatus Hydrogenedentota bacterium]